MAQLAIRGHATRGKEVIELLEMLGGKNSFYYDGTSKELIYTIGSSSELDVCNINSPSVKDGYIVFTLEEFLEKFPYKVGDKVRLPDYESEVKIERMKWDGYGVVYEVYTDDYEWFSVEELNVYNEPYKEQETKKASTEFFDRYCKKCGSQRCTAEGEWLEECKHYKEQEKMQNKLFTDMLDTLSSYLGDILSPEGVEKAIKYIQKNMDEYIEPQYTNTYPQYPSNYEECIGKLPINWDGEVKGYKSDLLYNLQKLLIARAVYWKIYGEQMGLGKPWEPDWTKGYYTPAIIYREGFIQKVEIKNRNAILVFPTEEMRDAFYENFKDLIEQCKELL